MLSQLVEFKNKSFASRIDTTECSPETFLRFEADVVTTALSNCPVATDNPFECPLTQMWVFILNMKTFIANNSDLIKGTC